MLHGKERRIVESGFKMSICLEMLRYTNSARNRRRTLASWICMHYLLSARACGQ